MCKSFIKFVIVFCLLLGVNTFAQSFESYKEKTKQNSAERTEILNKIRTVFEKEYKQDFIFTVNTLNVDNKYAWFKGEVLRRDGKEVIAYEYDDCCHAEALLKKSNGKWEIEDAVAFSTDVWWANIWERKEVSKDLILSN